MADEVGPHDRCGENIDHHHSRQDHARNDAGEEQVADRLVGQNRPHHHQQARRDQHSEARAAADQPQRIGRVVAVSLHLRVSDGGEGRRGGHAGAGDEAKDQIAHHGRVGEAAGQSPEPAVGGPEHVGRDTRARDELAHQQEQRHDREEIFAQRLVGGARDEIQAELEVAGRKIEREEADNAEADRDLDAAEHQRQQQAEQQIRC
jgi:hypothetical protein